MTNNVQMKDAVSKDKALADEKAQPPEVVDHRIAANRAGRSINKLDFPFGAKPEGDRVVEVADGVLWARIPLPWSLDHINVYLFDEGDSWTLIDTGTEGKRGRAVWEALLTGPLAGKPIGRVIGTHLHPDHIGLAGWLVRRFDARFAMTLAEYLTAKTLWLDNRAEVPDFELEFLFKAGVERGTESMIRSFGYGHFKKAVSELPDQYERLEDGTRLTIGGRSFIVVIGRGHSPEHACLYALDGSLILSGDQVLPGITSNVSVYAREPDANPLAHWISALDRMKGLEGDPLVLPSHGKVFRGLHIRLEDLIAGHIEKLSMLAAFCDTPKTVVGVFPALYQREVKGMDFYLALGEALAHLNFLITMGVMKKETAGTQEAPVNTYVCVQGFDPATVVAATARMPGVPLRPLVSLFGAP